MFLRRSAAVKYFLAAVLGAVIYCEWFIYLIQPLYWPKLQCQPFDSTCTKVLFVADPQIQGELAVRPPFSYLFNWDSDQYLKSTFSVVMKEFKPDVIVYLGDLMDEDPSRKSGYLKSTFSVVMKEFKPDVIVYLGDLMDEDPSRKSGYLKSTFSVVMKEFKPDVIVYLGDLMDEGSIATMVQFHGYVKRLSSIFEVDYPVVQVWLPGDNDIGGENESIKKDKVVEFDKIFNQPSIIAHRNISFYKVNGITHTIPESITTDNNFKIVVSHYPVTSRSVFGQQVHSKIKPDIYFCAHDHDSKLVKHDKNFQSRVSKPIKFGDGVINIPLNGDAVNEIYVPTCSYRMGTSNIGYGAAIIENNNRYISYVVFWSPSRFPLLFFYLAVLIVLTLYFIVFCLCKTTLKILPEKVRKGDDFSPLLDRV